MRYDFEIAVAQAVRDWIDSQLDPAITNKAPVVTFFDPMSVAESNRIIVMVPSGTTDDCVMSNAEVQVDVAVKSRWTEKTIAADFAAHWTRANAVRSQLFILDLPTWLNGTFAAAIPPVVGIQIDYVNNRRDFHTQIYAEGWIWSEISLRITCHATQ